MKIFIFVLLSGLSLLTQAAGEKLFFYQLDGPRGTVYLLGSMHLARPNIYPLREEITRAFESSDALVVEVDISGANQFLVQQMMLERGSYPPGQTIEQDLSASTWAMLQKEIRKYGMPIEAMARLRPGLLVTTLSTMQMMQMGLSPELGIDRHFLMQAQGAKQILELETMDQQISLLLDFPDQDLLVRQTLEQMDQMDLLMAELVSAWKQGDEARLEKLVIDDELARNPRYKALHVRMFDDRNRGMVNKLEQFMRRGGDYFVVVGAGHLVGDMGMVAMLRQRGYHPRQR